MRARPLDDRGYPVPFFVALVDGKYDFRIADTEKFSRCVSRGLCWLCGQQLGGHQHFTVGPMCLVNRLSSEPPAHLDCALFAVKACPFLTRPRAKRREVGIEALKEAGLASEPGGDPFYGNPGGCIIIDSRDWTVIRDPRGVRLINLGTPVGDVLWFVEGRPATREEAETMLDAGVGRLRAAAESEGHHALAHLERMVRLSHRYLPDARAA